MRVERLSISIDSDRANKLRSLVDRGAYPSISAAMDAATDVFLELEAEKRAWWQETLRRCDEAEKHPERLLTADEFHKRVEKEISHRKAFLTDL